MVERVHDRRFSLTVPIAVQLTVTSQSNLIEVSDSVDVFLPNHAHTSAHDGGHGIGGNSKGSSRADDADDVDNINS